MPEQHSAVTVVIPARYASSRFPGKPVARLAGKPLIRHVYERAQGCARVERVVVATDDHRIAEAVKAFDRKTRDFSMERALAVLEGLRGGQAQRKAG